MTEDGTETNDFYYLCMDCAMHSLKWVSDGMYISPTTDHARCFMEGCAKQAEVVCIVDKGVDFSLKPKQSDTLPEKTREDCDCRYMTVTEETLFKARKAIMEILPYEETADNIINELLNAGLLIRERI